MQRYGGPCMAIWRCWAQRSFSHPVRQREPTVGEIVPPLPAVVPTRQLAPDFPSLRPDRGSVTDRRHHCGARDVPVDDAQYDTLTPR